ncbi:hypothetical protein ETR14_27595 (plasmid) [Sphingosinicella sp. BN140058]|nr:hypothetical protein ETR14_27595 [Sphingosinicella sp. BN140058]
MYRQIKEDNRATNAAAKAAVSEANKAARAAAQRSTIAARAAAKAAKKPVPPAVKAEQKRYVNAPIDLELLPAYCPPKKVMFPPPPKGKRKSRNTFDRVGAELERTGERWEAEGERWFKRGARNVKNSVRLFIEGPCDRKGRKYGEKARRECRRDQAERKRNASQQPRSSDQPATYLAVAELDCWKPGNEDRWGTTRVIGSSGLSRADAQRDAEEQINEYPDLCQTRWNDANLRKGEHRWVDR